MREKSKTAVLIISFAVVVYIILYYGSASHAALEGLELWINNVLPTLFPMFVISRILLESGASEKLSRRLRRPMTRIFKTGKNAPFAYLMSLLSGYPAGTKNVCDMYRKKLVNKRDAFVLLCLCSNPSAVFLIASVGGVFFKSNYAGILLLISTYLSCFFSGLAAALLFSPENDVPDLSARKKYPPAAVVFTASVTDAFGAILNVGAFIIFFNVLVSAAGKIFVLLGMSEQSFSNGVFTSAAEMAAGAKMLGAYFGAKPALSLIFCSGLMAFGGLCIFFQSLSFISATDLDADKYFLFKLFQGALSALITYILYKATARIVSECFTQGINSAFVTLNPLLFSCITVMIVVAWIAIELAIYAKKRRQQCKQ